MGHTVGAALVEQKSRPFFFTKLEVKKPSQIVLHDFRKLMKVCLAYMLTPELVTFIPYLKIKANGYN